MSEVALYLLSFNSTAGLNIINNQHCIETDI